MSTSASQAVSPAVPGGQLSCLKCGSTDRLSSASAVVREGRSTAVVRGQIMGSPGVDLPFRASASKVSGLAEAVAAPRRPMSPAVPVAGLVVAGAVELAVVESAVSEGGRYGTGALAVVLGVVVGLLAALVPWWRREAARRGQTVERAWYLWRRSWYCRRCGVVSVIWDGGFRVLAARNLAADLVVLAGQLLWKKRA
jgi:hypothetical protein